MGRGGGKGIGYAAPLLSVYSTTFAREHLVHHFAGEPKIGCRVAHLLELWACEVAGDISILRQQLDQGRPGGRDLATDVVDQVVRPLPPEMRPEPHHHGLPHHTPPAEIHIASPSTRAALH